MVARLGQSKQPSCWLWSIIAPVALFFAYVVVSRRVHAFGMSSDFAAMAASCALGCWPMLHLRLPIFARVLCWDTLRSLHSSSRLAGYSSYAQSFMIVREEPCEPI